MVLILFLFLLVIDTCKTCELKSPTFALYLKHRLLSGFQNQSVITDKLVCFKSCYDDDECIGVAYHKSTKMCYLFDQFPSCNPATTIIHLATYFYEGLFPKNIALNRRTVNSSKYSSEYKDYHSCQAVDGNMNTMYNSDDGSFEWWCVDLGNVYKFKYIVIYNRNGSLELRDRLKGFQLTFSDKGRCAPVTFDGVSPCYTDSEPNSLPLYNITSCQNGISFSSRFVFIQSRPNTPLNLVEVVVIPSD